MSVVFQRGYVPVREGVNCPVLCVVYDGSGTVTRSVNISKEKKVEEGVPRALPKMQVRRSSLARRATFADVGFLTVGQDKFATAANAGKAADKPAQAKYVTDAVSGSARSQT